MSNLKYGIIMEKSNRTPMILGITPEQYEKYNREYTRLNPHGLPEIRPKRRRIPARSELIYSIQKQQ